MKSPRCMPVPKRLGRPGLSPSKIRRVRAAAFGLANELEAIAQQVGGEAARAIRTAPTPEAAVAAAKASAAGRATRAELSNPELRAEAIAFARLRRAGWRPLPSGDWRSPSGITCTSFSAALRCLESTTRNRS